MIDTIILAILAGALGGLIRSIYGYTLEKDTDEAFDFKKTGKSVIRSTIGGVIVVYGLIQIQEITLVTAFFSALLTGPTIDLFWHSTNKIMVK